MIYEERIEIRNMDTSDWDDVAFIFKEGIKTGIATFEQKIPTWEEWDNKHSEICRLVATVSGRIVGWGAISPVSKREVYAGVAEVSIYVSERVRGFGIGTIILEKIIYESELEGIWTLQSNIFLENIASIKMHTRLGFREVGIRERIGKMDEEWKSTVLMEKRSSIIGAEI